MRASLWRIVEVMRQTGADKDAAVQRDLGALIAKVDASCAVADRYLQRRIAGEEGAGDASIVKLTYSRTLRDFTKLGFHLSRLGGQYWSDFTSGGSQETGNWAVDFMNSYAWSIAGGSDEIQRNIISERMLMMPREPKNWKLTGDRP